MVTVGYYVVMLDTPERSLALPDAYGFCKGVVGAVDLAELAITEARNAGIETVYGLHDIVHDRRVTARLESLGLVFVDTVEEIPRDQVTLTSAHGIGDDVRHALMERGSTIIDATCPLVTATHIAAERARREAATLVYICHDKPDPDESNRAELHDEVQGMMGNLHFYIDDKDDLVHSPVERRYLELGEDFDLAMLPDTEQVRVAVQTTLIDTEVEAYQAELRAFIARYRPDTTVRTSHARDVCRAVRERQEGVEQLVQLKPRQLIVVTDPKSANGNGYADYARMLTRKNGTQTDVYTVADASEAANIPVIDGLVAVTASASAPTEAISGVISALGFDNYTLPAQERFHLSDLTDGVVHSKIAAHLARINNN